MVSVRKDSTQLTSQETAISMSIFRPLCCQVMCSVFATYHFRESESRVNFTNLCRYILFLTYVKVVSNKHFEDFILSNRKSNGKSR